MNKTDLIKEAESKLENERLEAEKQKVLSEVRFIENRIRTKEILLAAAIKEFEKLNEELDKEKSAANKYKETGDYEAYKKELDIKDTCPYLHLNGTGSTLTFTSGGNSYWSTANGAINFNA